MYFLTCWLNFTVTLTAAGPGTRAQKTARAISRYPRLWTWLRGLIRARSTPPQCQAVSPLSDSRPTVPGWSPFPGRTPDGDTVRCQQVKMVETPGGGNPSFLHVFDQVRKCTLFDGFACNAGQNFTSRWLKNAINEYDTGAYYVSNHRISDSLYDLFYL